MKKEIENKIRECKMLELEANKELQVKGLWNVLHRRPISEIMHQKWNAILYRKLYLEPELEFRQLKEGEKSI